MITSGTAILLAILTPAIGLLGILLGARLTIDAQVKISEKERKDKFRLAALDKRLEVHQEAYILWSKLTTVMSAPGPVKNKIIGDCHKFWLNNCLYLDSKARDAFHSSFILAGFYEPGPQNRGDFNKIMEAGKYIVEGVELPSLGERESERIGGEDES